MLRKLCYHLQIDGGIHLGQQRGMLIKPAERQVSAGARLKRCSNEGSSLLLPMQ